MVSRLPITTRPAHQEIAVSYLARLAALHDMPFAELWQQASRSRGSTSTRRTLDGDLLATVANQPRERLNHAIIELHTPEPDWLALRHEPQRSCRRCSARHPGGPVLQLLGHHDYVCTRHRIWIGPPDHPDDPQPNLDQLPEVTAAQHRHRRLLRRIGPAATYDAVLTGFLICAHRWSLITKPDEGDAWNDWRRRAEILIPPGTETDTFTTSRLFAATYPEAVAIAELVGSLHWRRLAAGDPSDQALFATAIGARLGLRDYRPTALRDPIAHWIDQDCWRPPSRPYHDYRSLRTFGGHTYRKAMKGADEKRRATAEWFARHRRGGDAMLHHRTINPVVVRDWSATMELFSSTVQLSASISHTSLRALEGGRARTAVNLARLATAPWSRPEPQPSPFLDTATEPVPWTEKTRDRKPYAGRPVLPAERRAMNRLPATLRARKPTG